MLTLTVFSVCIALCGSATWQLPHGHDLKVAVDEGFTAFDKNKDGQLSFQELGAVFYNEDLNHDGNLTLVEYAAYFHTTPDIMAPIFHVWDQDGNGYIQKSDLSVTDHLLDHDGDGSVSLHEYEHYMTGFLECVYSHGQHGHGPNCDH